MRTHRLALVGFAALTMMIAAPPVWSAEVPFDAEIDLLVDFDGAAAVALGPPRRHGVPTFATCARIDGRVEYWVGSGGGAFGHSVAASGLDSPTALALGDLDGDGDDDIVVGQYNNIPLPFEPWFHPEAAEILWLRNPRVGGGGWTTFAISYLNLAGVRAVALADLDRDGDLDIVEAAAGGVGAGLAWHENDGTPADTEWVPHSVTAGGELEMPQAVVPADVDRDGDLDLVTADVTGDAVLWFENDGVPSDYWASHAIGTLDRAGGVAVGDIDRDGAVDVAAVGPGVGPGGQEVKWYERSGATWTAHTVRSGVAGFRTVTLVDLDVDGDLDMLLARGGADVVLWLENTDGVGGAWTDRTIGVAFGAANDAVAADLDGDGDPDVLAAAFSGDRVSWWENQSIHRGFAAAEPIAVRTDLGNPQALTLADLNRDGLLDIVTAQRGSDAVTAYLGFTPDGTSWWTNAISTTFDGARDVTVADLNGDGRPDVVGAAVDQDVIRWWQNEGGALPTWSARTLLTGVDGAHRVRAADFDRDGTIDLAVAAFDSGRIEWVANERGTGTHGVIALLDTLAGAFDLAVADFNADGRPDLAASGYDADAVKVYLNGIGAGGAWVPDTVSGSVDGPRGIAAADIDGDADVDLVVLVRNTNAIRWYANNGTGTSWTGHDVGLGTFEDGAAVRAVDLDGDGDADVVATSQAGDDVYVWRNGGDGAEWVRDQMEQGLDSPWDVAVGDVNRDGRRDLVVAAGGSADRVVWYPNIGSQVAGLAQDWSPSALPNGAEDVVLYFIAHHQGRAGDARAELARIRLDLETSTGTPLTSAQANAIIARLAVYQDTDRDSTLTAADALVVNDPSLALVLGRLDLSVADGLAAAEIAATDARGYFVVVEATSDASAQVPNRVRITLPGADGLVVEDRDHDLVLTQEPRADRQTKVIAFAGVVGTRTPTPTGTPAPTRTPTRTWTPTRTATPLAGRTPTPTTGPPACAGDCDGSGDVTVDEIVIAVNIALGTFAADQCPAVDTSGDGEVTVDEIVVAVTNALAGCD